MTSQTEIRVLSFLPDEAYYRDRALLFREVSKATGGFFLITGDRNVEMEVPGFDRFQRVDLRPLRGARPWNMWRASRLAERLIRDRGVNVVHDTFSTFLPLLFRKARYPHVSFVTSLFATKRWAGRHTHRDFQRPGRVLHQVVNSWVESQTYSRSDHVIVQAPGLVERVTEGLSLPEDRVSVITNNVDTDYWFPLPEERSDRTRPEGPKLLFVGGIHTSKRHLLLLEVLVRLKKEGIRASLTVVGNSQASDRAEALDMVAENALGDAVQFVPRVGRDQLRSLYRDSDLFVYPTDNDGSPRVVLEALATGLPVVASRHPGINVLDPSSEFIEFFRSGGAEEIAVAVRDLWRSPAKRSERGSVGRRAVLDRFSTAVVAQRYIDLYRALRSGSQT